MFNQITNSFSALSKRLRGKAHLSESNLDDILREIRMSLLEADVALPVVRDFLAKVKAASIGQKVLSSLNPGEMFVGIFHQELQKTLSGGSLDNTPWELRASAPAVILMAGLQGVGKTTQSAKIALWLKKQKKKVLLVSVDASRPAAVEQLKVLAAQIEVDFFAPPESSINQSGQHIPQKVALAALEEAKKRLYDVLIVDTAGRLSVDEEMMDELVGLEKKLTPNEVWLTIDAMQGQSALATAESFAKRISITGLVLTKADGDSRGGAVLSAHTVTGAPIRFTGISEKMDGLELFDAKRMADRIVGMGDMVGLFESAVANVDQASIERMTQKLKKGKGFDLNDLYEQLGQIRKMGGLESLLEKMPVELQNMANKAPGQFSNHEVNKMQGIINSMTIREKAFPDLLKASRKKRIAAGSGTSVQEINRLLKQFTQMEKMSKKFKGMSGMLAKMGNMGGQMPNMSQIASMMKNRR